MKTLAALLVCAASAASAAPAVQPSTSTAAAATLFPRCRDGALDPEALLADRTAVKAVEMAPLPELPAFYACRALAGSGAGCAALEGLGGAQADAAATCRELEREARFMRAALGGGDAAALCREQFKDRPDRASVQKACASAVAAAAAGRPQDACADLRAAGLNSGKDPEDCARRMRHWSGRAEDCAGLGDEGWAGRCRLLAGLAAGLREPSACASSPLCRASSGKPGACAAFTKALSERVCGEAGAQARMRAEDRRGQEKREAAERAEAARQEAAKAKAAKAEKARKPQFHKGEAMQTGDGVTDIMKKVERHEPLPPSATKRRDDAAGGTDESKEGR